MLMTSETFWELFVNKEVCAAEKSARGKSFLRDMLGRVVSLTCVSCKSSLTCNPAPLTTRGILY